MATVFAEDNDNDAAACGGEDRRRGTMRAKIKNRKMTRVTAGTIVAGACLLAPAAALAGGSISLKEAGSLKRVGAAKGLNLTEKGTASGTIDGSISLSLHVVSTNKVTATVTVSPKGGSLSGSGSASYHVQGSNAYFGGTLSITKGSGSWSGAHASDLKFSGKIERASGNVSVSLSGTLYK